MKIYRNYIKRFLDIILSLIGMVLLSPLLLIVAITIRFKLGSPIIFTQNRPGKNGKIFKLYKFRSMSDRRNSKGELLPDSERLPKFGQILRSSSFDELPELWNIFIGDMSIVGPRPLLLEYLPLYNDKQKRRHEVRPGLTGYAQVNGRNTLNWINRFEYDVQYVDDLSFIMDFKIVLLTIKKVFIKEGISSDTSKTMEPFKGNEYE